MSAPKIDITLLLEGTYPFVRGGVSSWVHQIIRAFPEYRFAVVFLGGRRSDNTEKHYALPINVVHFEQHYLYDGEGRPPIAPCRGATEAFKRIELLHSNFKDQAWPQISLAEIAPEIMPGGSLGLSDFLHSQLTWEFICANYEQHCADPSFVDFFWTVRTMHAPLWKLASIAAGLPRARVYHTVSTGYAGFLAALLHHRDGRPMLCSEHGIYTKERKIDLLSTEWIRDNRNVFQKDPTQVAYLRQLWVRFFEALGRFCYGSADSIIALFEANRARQIRDGAPPERTSCVPNGVSLSALAPLRVSRPMEVPQVMCLIGRIVPIKDVKTFIRAARIVMGQLPHAEAWIAGPDDEDQDYARECRQLADGLELGEKVRFLGFQTIPDLLPKIGVNVLSSISEGLPLVIIEGFAAGVPAVATDVGACRELIEGLDPDDRALGEAGAVTPIADPQALADAIVPLLSNPGKWHAASRAAIARVEQRYREEQMIDRYRHIYRAALVEGG